MDRGRLPTNSDLYLEDGFWKVRWRDDTAQADDVKSTHITQLACIGPATGPQAIPENEARRLVWKSLISEGEKKEQAENSRMTVAEFVERKFVPEHVALKGFSGQTHYRSMLKHVLTPEEVDGIFRVGKSGSKSKLKAIPDWPYLSNVPLCDVGSHHAHCLTSAAVGRGYSSQTVAHIRNVIGAIFSHAKQAQCFAGENPVSTLRLSKVTRKEAHSLTLSQAKEALRVMRYPEKEMMLMTVFTDMNMAEICGLQWGYVNLTGMTIDIEGEIVPPKTIAVRRQWYRGKSQSVKKNRSRNLPIPQPLLETLIRLKSREDFTHPDDFVLVTRVGTAVNLTNTVARRLQPVGKKLGIPSLSWHVFRRTSKALSTELGSQFQDSIAIMVHSATAQNRGTAQQWRCRVGSRRNQPGCL
jgi:integrase